MEKEDEDSFDELPNWDAHLNSAYSDQVASWQWSTIENNLMLAEQLEIDGSQKFLEALLLNKSLNNLLWKEVASRIPKKKLIKLLTHHAHVAAMLDVMIEITQNQNLAFKLVRKWCSSLNIEDLMISSQHQEFLPPLLTTVINTLIQQHQKTR
ncbi:hypothetical protein HMI54_003864 [Coelomomyces lativittatus]|nr:hypothetical protein HMI56_002374 [Coelomomyces lativittatus]KAJ1506961.1 hypothetical protein HMI55_000962 [Coelomomyces lativittatus]KAJ1507736.1 hypothetical protein HMI54_003864 [Coelomomyces lativittatus]